jgi:parallel beta-helix repeat protein
MISSYAVRQWDPGNRMFIEQNTISNVPVGIDLENCADGSTMIENTFTNVPTQTVISGSGCKPITSY